MLFVSRLVYGLAMDCIKYCFLSSLILSKQVFDDAKKELTGSTRGRELRMSRHTLVAIGDLELKGSKRFF